jgi:hypothetical protein
MLYMFIYVYNIYIQVCVSRAKAWMGERGGGLVQSSLEGESVLVTGIAHRMCSL